MKKILFFLLFIIMIPVVYAKDNVSIEKIELISKGDNVIINSEPTYSGIEMNYDVAYKSVGDAVKYKVTVKNNTNTDYEIASETTFSESNYIKYEYEVGDVLKANSSIDVMLTITYNKEIEDSKFVDDVYSESNKAVVKLLNENVEVNPNTSSMSLVLGGFVITLLLLGTSLILIKNKSVVKGISILLISGLIVVPVLSKALEELRLKANVKVKILKAYKVVYTYGKSDVYLTLEEGVEEGYKETECHELYYGENYSELKYYCSKTIYYEDPIKYEANAIVKVKEISETGLKWYDDSVGGICATPNGEDFIRCDYIEYETVVHDRWVYTKNNNSTLGFTYRDNDDDVMNFPSEDVDPHYTWEVGGYMGIAADDTFTMPKHNVLFILPQSG